MLTQTSPETETNKYAMKISYLLATNRQKTYPHVLKQAIDSINAQPTKYEYEILVYAEDEVVGDHVRWIKEDIRRGQLYGTNLMMRYFAQGEYMVGVTDDIKFLNSIDLCIDMIESPAFANRKFKICGLACGGTCAIPPKNTRIGDVMHIKEDMPQGIILRWPVVQKDTIDKYMNGYMVHPRLYHAAGDIWLGYYLAVMGEPAIEGPTRIWPILDIHDASWELQDCNTVYAFIVNHKNGEPGYVNMRWENEALQHQFNPADIFLSRSNYDKPITTQDNGKNTNDPN